MKNAPTRPCTHPGCKNRVGGKNRVCIKHLKAITKMTTTEVRAGNRGRNARGLSLHRPDVIRTRKAKGQRGATPPIALRASTIDPGRILA